MRVEFTAKAAAQYRSAFDRIADANRFASQRFAARLGERLRQIGRFPQSGHFVAEFATLPVRQFIVEPYRFFYRVDEARRIVFIVDVWHGAQLPIYPPLTDVGAPR